MALLAEVRNYSRNTQFPSKEEDEDVKRRSWNDCEVDGASHGLGHC